MPSLPEGPQLHARYARIVALIAGSVVERVYLFRRALDQAARGVGGHPTVQPIVETLAAVASSLESKHNWPDLIAAYRRLRDVASADEQLDFDLALEILGAVAHQTARLPQYLSLLPSDVAPYPIARLLESAFDQAYSDVEPVIVVLPDLDFYEFDLRDWITRDAIFQKLVVPENLSARVIRICMVDAQSPLSWPILAHELAHAIAQRHDLVAKLEADLAQRLKLGSDTWADTVKSHGHELLADSIAALALGPSVVLSGLRFELSLLTLPNYLPVATETHPSLSARLTVARRILGNSSFNPFEGTLDTYASITRLWLARADKDVADFERWYATDILPHLADVVEEVIAGDSALPRTFDGEKTLERAERMANRLSREVPPAAVRWYAKRVVRPVLEQAGTSADGNPTDEFKSALDMLRERPAGPASLLAAGFLRREAPWTSVIEQALAGQSSTWAWTTPIRDFLEREDELIRASVATADVHRTLIKSVVGFDQAPSVPAARTVEPEPRVPRFRRARSSASRGGPPASPPRAGCDADGGGLLGDRLVAMRLVDLDDERRFYLTPLIDPSRQIGPSSIDLRLGTDALVIANVNMGAFDPTDDIENCNRQIDDLMRRHRVTPENPLVLHPGEFALAASLEFLKMPLDLAGRLEGRSSCGRLGLLIHATAGFVDPGFEGNVTFELSNAGKVPVKLLPGVRIGQLCLMPSRGTTVPYSKKKEFKYAWSLTTLPSRWHHDVEFSWYRKLKE